jgi:hypothetical protein
MDTPSSPESAQCKELCNAHIFVLRVAKSEKSEFKPTDVLKCNFYIETQGVCYYSLLSTKEK